MVSHKKLYVAAVVLVVAAVSSQPPPPVPQHVSAAPTLLEAPDDRQAGLGVALGSLLLPLATSLLSTLTSNIGTAITNAFSATMAGGRLELIPVEEMIGAKSITQERPPPQASQRHGRGSTTTKPTEQDRRK